MVSRSLARLIHQTPFRQVSLSSASCSSPASSSKSILPPLRYHIFSEPLPYLVGLKLQNDIISTRLKAKAKDPVGSRGKGDVILMLEHTPTYTTGRRDNSPNPNELHPEEKKVQNVGAEFYITKRGGQVTYHGPGQLVGYPILDLNVMETPTRCYVEYLQAMLAEYARDDLGIKGVLAPHPEGHVGVFSSPTEKFASIGIHLSHRITSHGFAMNITPQPIKWFDLVMACGLADVHATSLHQLLLRDKADPTLPSVPDVAQALIPKFGELFSRDITPLREEKGGDDNEELVQISSLVMAAEEEAERLNKGKGWPGEPDLSRRA
ncbi:lipoyl(octanoyl) transferase [Kwoniella dejecticola CBS 10117]|uniref:lipoyl(octanoyl) transferase n=1 Tax=Kwoniella dejecticola CBS 10117 TaxID=1296121 RepID=A0A1A6A1F7_9TREE|nr:lipoyl(octanoyl) transferase [Kwoniella dejecticola CBS 10117]OBR83894.1 lipoyl(octanoyl) transferase [Kwoniella dejecticola CBS 10117]